MVGCQYFYHSSAGKIVLKVIPKLSFLCGVIVIAVKWTTLLL